MFNGENLQRSFQDGLWMEIEVDGVKFHAEGTRQAERDAMKNSILNKYGLPILRFKTDGSNESERLLNAIGNL